MLYSIADWDSNFEIQQSRRNAGRLNWVAIPTRHDGKGFRRLSRLPDGPAIYCAWSLIVQVAAKCPKRGVLADDDGPLTAEDLADKTGFPQEIFEKAFNVLCDKKIGWLKCDSVVEQSHSDTTAVLAQYDYVQTDEQTDVQTNKHGRTNETYERNETSDHEDSVLRKAEGVEAAVAKAVPIPAKEQAFVRKCAMAVATGKIPEQWVISAANGVKAKNPGKPFGYFTTVLRESCQKGGFDFKSIYRIALPDRWGTGPPAVTVRVNRPPESDLRTQSDLMKELQAAAQK